MVFVMPGLEIEPLTPLNVKWFEIYARASAVWFLQALPFLKSYTTFGKLTAELR